MAVARDELLAQDGQDEPSFAAWLIEAVLLALGVLVAITALSVFLMTVDVTARALLPVLAIAAGGLLSGALLLRRASQAQWRAQDSSSRLRGMLDRAPDGIVLLDATTARRLYVNASAARLFGLTVAELKSVPMESINVPTQANGESALVQSRRLLRHALAGEDVQADWRFRRADGSEFPARLGLTRIPGKGSLVRVSISDLSVEVTLEASRQSAEARIRTLVDNAPDGIVLVEPLTHLIRYANRAAAHLLRADAARLPGQRITVAAVNPQPGGLDPQALLVLMEREVMAGRESVRRWRLRRLDGVEINAEVRALLLPGEEGLFRVSLIDLTAQDELGESAARAEAALRAGEARFRHLTHISADWYWETDASSCFTLIDGGGEEQRAQQRVLIGRAPWDIARFVPLDLGWEEVRTAQLARQPYRQTIRYRKPGMHEEEGRVLEIAADPILDPTGAFVGYRGVGRDVTERFRTLERLRRSEETAVSLAAANAIVLHHRDLTVNSMPVAFMVRDAEHRIISWNPEAERMFGFSSTEAIGKQSNELLLPVELRDAVRAQHQAIREGTQNTTLVVSNITKSGARILCEWRNARITGSNGEFVGSIGMALDITARKRAEEALLESEERLRRLVSLSSDWEWAQDEHFLFTHVGELQGEHGRPVSASVGRARWDNPWLRPIGFTWEEHRALLEAHQPFSHTLFEFTDPAGQRFYWAIRGEPVFDSAGQFRGYRGVGTDISTRYRYDALRLGERALFEGMAQGATLPALSTMLAQTLCGVLERDSAVIIKEHRHIRLQRLGTHGVRPGWSTVLEHTLTLDVDPTTCGEAARTGGICVAADAASEPRYAGMRDQIIALGIGATWSMPVIGNDGVVMATIGVACPAAGAPSGQDTEFAKTVARLTEFVLNRFRSAEAVRESAERYRRLVEQSQEGVLIHDWGIVEYANPAFLCMAGAARMEDLVGMHVVKLYAKASQVRAQERLARLREAEGSLGFTEMTLQRLDGGLVEVEVAANVFELHGRRMVQSQFRDISARKFTEREILNMNEELEQRVSERTSELSVANRELEAFSYTVAHDLRAPLRAIDGFSQLLKADLGGALTTDTQRDLDAISTSARRMADLINGLLDFSRVGRHELNRRRVNMQALAESVSAEMAEDHPVQVQIGRLPEVHGDSIMLRQVWANLIGNAVKFSAKKSAPRVTIECVVEAGEARFAVADNGDGIDMAYADKLFGVFQRMHSAEEFEGTGVGLAIVKRIVERHGGRVWVQSAPGAGARFFFTLPVSGVNAVDAVAGTVASAAAATIEMKG